LAAAIASPAEDLGADSAAASVAVVLEAAASAVVAVVSRAVARFR